MRIVLASASPRRRELLAAAGLEFDVDPVDVDETRLPDEPPEAYVERVACDKARTAALRHPGRVVLAADTAVLIDGDLLGKPGGDVEATRMLRRLSGRAHQVLTGVAVMRDGETWSAVERTSVLMASLSDAEIRWYVASGEAADKAGAYAIQGLGALFVERIDGNYSNVVGLPLPLTRRLFAELGFDLLALGGG
jgi:septum formation protein